MSVSVRIPTPLRKVTNGEDKADAEGNTVSAIIASLDSQFPGIKSRLCDENGELRSFVNIYINGEDIRFMDGVESGVDAGDEISIVPAVAGGQIV
jgi:molybdopterin synthase sulfur carrier subunit|tara:strand:+ start:2024 stop:2308 length:285 start_codon:yes stop_codon:yes gene_type:complete